MGHYAVLPVGAGAVEVYRNPYFDTPELRCLHDHRRGVGSVTRSDQALSRSRAHVLEIEIKRGEARTDKLRRALGYCAAMALIQPAVDTIGCVPRRARRERR